MTKAIGFGFKPQGEMKMGNFEISYKDLEKLAKIRKNSPKLSPEGLGVVIKDTIEISKIKEGTPKFETFNLEKMRWYFQYNEFLKTVQEVVENAAKKITKKG